MSRMDAEPETGVNSGGKGQASVTQTEAENTEIKNAEAGSTAAEKTDAAGTTAENAEVKQAEVQNADAAGTEAKKADTQKADAKKADEKKADVKKTDAGKDEESEEEKLRRRRRSAVQGALVFLMLSAAVIIMAVSTQIPVLQIYGIYMRPTLDAGDIVVCIHTKDYGQGDLIAFRLDNKILVRRVIGLGGDEVSVDKDGVVTVNEKELEEPYVDSLALGQSNISYPYTVPQGKVFVMGDSRETAVDSRNSAVGCVDTGEAEGKVVFRLWPASGIGFM